MTTQGICNQNWKKAKHITLAYQFETFETDKNKITTQPPWNIFETLPYIWHKIAVSKAFKMGNNTRERGKKHIHTQRSEIRYAKNSEKNHTIVGTHIKYSGKCGVCLCDALIIILQF